MQFTYRNLSRITKITALLCMLFLSAHTTTNAAGKIHVGVLLDGPIEREYVPLEQIIREIKDLNRGEFNIEFLSENFKHGSWEVADIKVELLASLNDPNIDVIISNGILGSQQAAQIKNLSKPVIAAVVADRELQRLPYKDQV